MTSQVSKVVERVLARNLIIPFVKSMSLFGDNQFAYTTARGARDIPGFFVLSSLLAFARGQQLPFIKQMWQGLSIVWTQIYF